MDSLFSESDWDSFSESSEEMDLLFGGQAVNLLSNLEESIGKIDDFLSFERGFVHGDIVCSVQDPSGQLGKVINVDMFVDLESTHGKVIRDINSKKLIKVRSISVGDHVVYGHWLGRVDKVIDSVTILFDDGTKCDFTGVNQEKLIPISPNIVDDSQYSYYPGQRVKVMAPSASQSARWLCGSWKANQEEGTVCAVKAGFVNVDWLGSVLMDGDFRLPQPSKLHEAKDLTPLSCFPHANWQLGDWCILPGTDYKNHLNGSGKLDKGFQRRGTSISSAPVFIIARTKTKVDVFWQDGSCSLGVDSQSLLPINIIDSHEFWPDQFVQETNSCDDPHAPISRKWGVVRGMDAKEKTVRIIWKNASMETPDDIGGEHLEETMSAYELLEHPDYSYCLGDVVFRVVQNQSVVQATKDPVETEATKAEEAVLKSEKFGRDHKGDPNNFYLSCIGNVSGFKDGAVAVKWANGLTTKVAPYEIIRCDKYDGSTPSPLPFDGNIEQINQQVVENEILPIEKGKDLLFPCTTDEECPKPSSGSTSFSLPQNAKRFLTSVAATLFGSFGSASESGSVQFALISEDGNGCQASFENAVVENCCDTGSEIQSCAENELPASEWMSLKVEVKDDQEERGLLSLSKSKDVEQFKQFDMVTDCSDHHFLDGADKGVASSQVKKGWLKKVQQEWSILEKNLPETIYVRIYEERIDLLRAAIVGPPGTPYHDGLFFFDIFLPPEFPNEPPMVHYHSGGLRVNPNLYESGKVCLSLLNTWTGSGSEVWNPGSSTVLQVLVSLQALVLNDKPYFNEAGYDKQLGKTEGERNSVSYNENAFLMTCKSMLYLLRKPPKHFEALVEEHFSNRSDNILYACKEYMKGAPVGFAFGGGEKAQETQKGSSTGFKIMLAKLFTKLVDAFSEKGIDCSRFLGA
ncbi:probable ubiquitin-conjugating enzyme E2 24 [Syzygium oleosum]|uniref:probable ubiquitin-conjugating enzyme E2 24 n=1 Tax=Syzygium oleosum TaxID=219896 RepID=UPI0024B923B2|nr:probable ubiquitin-conjugating enzyme E2 24 [Syzygium oleosum]XP_056175629.1 probable ubiquitin-conjugating enzyme E2 24 [Syzygium oleosum]XP_056175630.1 probable ubiquitin-conjugating enzyme E2 24 [Syzygium oleosum]XP_056175631.1 probable ubiquitin-conjugating enzyme E2 24 [Syzygium oleosum]